MKKIKLTLSAMAFIGTFFGQQPWKDNGNNANPGDFLGTKNNQDLDFKTNDQLRFRINSNGKIVAKNDFNVQGTLTTDSLVVEKGARIKGVLHIGLNSLSLASGPFSGSDFITSSNGLIAFGGGAPFTNFQDIKIGIGITNPLARICNPCV